MATKCPVQGKGKGWWLECRKGLQRDGRDQAGVLDEGLGDVRPRPEEVSYATPSCEKVTPG